MLSYSAWRSQGLQANISDGLPVCLEQDMPVPTHSKQRSPCCTDTQRYSGGGWVACPTNYAQDDSEGNIEQPFISISDPRVNMASGWSQGFTRRTSKGISKTALKDAGWLMGETDPQDSSRRLRGQTLVTALLLGSAGRSIQVPLLRTELLKAKFSLVWPDHEHELAERLGFQTQPNVLEDLKLL